MTKKLTLRPFEATEDDVKLLFRWRNDPTTYLQSRVAEPVKWAPHVRWCAAAHESHLRHIYIAMVGNEPIGQVRLDALDPGWELSWSIAREHRGQGHATEMVRLAMTGARGPFLAEIKPGNTASKRVAAANGMEFVEMHEGLEVWQSVSRET